MTTSSGSLALVAAGCLLSACIANTPQQDLAYARWAQCNAPYTSLERVDLDGRIVFLYTDPATREDVWRCLADAGRSGPPLPAPIAVAPRGGP
jgi:hypothetical protein